MAFFFFRLFHFCCSYLRWILSRYSYHFRYSISILVLGLLLIPLLPLYYFYLLLYAIFIGLVVSLFILPSRFLSFLKMETACMKIKFSPLLLNGKMSQSKCCLEIVPQVSCVKNLDKLEWKQKAGLVEYVIPMTYKIILRKQSEDKCNDNNRIYHSCVDLLMAISKSNIALASGDTPKIISDTFIINKLSHAKSKEDFLNFTKTEHKGSVILESSVPTKNRPLQVINVIKKAEDILNEELLKAEQPLNNIENTLRNNTTSTENISSIFTKDIQPKSPAKIANKIEFSRKLSVSPIFTINTQEKAFAVSNNILAWNAHDSQKDLAPITSISRSTTNDIQISNPINSIDSCGLDSIKSVRYTASERSPPEIRIAQYMRYLETELSPLHISLNELINKCIILGLHGREPKFVDPRINKVLLYKSVCIGNDHIPTETRKKVISNRAVYTIVFDG